MHSIFSRFSLGIIALALLVAPAAAQFSDTTGHRYETAIMYVQGEGIVQGYADGNYRPNISINRAEFTKIMIEAAGLSPQTCTSPPFLDVPTNTWYAPYVCAAVQNHVISGYPDGTFRPDATVNYAEAAKIVVESFDLPIHTTTGPWYQPYVQALVSANVDLNPGPAPADLVTRGEMAFMIYAVLVPEEPDDPPQNDCVVAGCSSQLCIEEGEEPAFTTCEWRPEYACYQQYGTCERQSSGECGWTENEQFNQCLREAEEDEGEGRVITTETRILLDGEVVLTISEFSDEIAVSSGATFGSSDRITNASLSPDQNWISIAVAGAAHDFGWIYNRQSEELRPVVFQYGGGVQLDGWSSDSRYAYYVKETPEPSTERVQIDTQNFPEYPQVADE